MNVDKDLARYFDGEPPGQRTNAIRWLQKMVMKKSLGLPREFATLAEWEEFKTGLRRNLPAVIGMPVFPPLKESTVRARVRVGDDVVCERVDVYVDDDYGIPSFVFLPARLPSAGAPGLVWNPGWQQTKWMYSHQRFAERMARKGFAVIVPDHAPFGETAPYQDVDDRTRMTLTMGMGHVLGISQLALRAAETIRCGEYLRSRPDVDAQRVAVAGLCQGGQDTWLSAALDDRFCAAAPICAASTFAIHFAEMASYRANGDASPFPFNMLSVCDVEHLHAAIAPRPLLVRVNLGDNWWPVSGYDVVEALTRKIYRLYNAEDRVDFRAEIHEHDITGPFADALEHFLLKYV